MLAGEQFSLAVHGHVMDGAIDLLSKLVVNPGVFWAQVVIHGANGNVLALDGMPNAIALQMRKAVMSAIDAKQHRAKVAELIKNFDLQIRLVADWVRLTVESCKAQLLRRGWLSREFMSRASESKPKELNSLLEQPEIASHLERQPDTVKDAVKLWRQPLEQFVAGINRRHAERAARDDQAFFDSVENSPLTTEQREAVICLDSRVLLVASAGSGKTSTMVAKAGYALKHGYFMSEKMLLLAFNNAAAAELRERLQARLMPLGLPADKVVAKTFHAFGLDVIGTTTGRRPSLASWLDNGQDVEALLRMADALKDSDLVFRMRWDLFRLVFGQDLPKFGQEEEFPDSWDKQNNRNGFWTLNNEVVKSRGELVIANWLFYNGVKYVYEAPYETDTADASHRQYTPDFYLPDAKAYLEHWAVDENGEPPKAFVGYKEGMKWKRELHAQRGTKLLETTMADLWSGKALNDLAAALTELGVVLDPNPERPVAGRNPIESPRLARTFRAFLTHVKNNRLTMDELRHRLRSGAAGTFRFRHEMFLQLFETLWNAWENRLRADQCIDFEDMLNQATDCIETGRWVSPYELVMVDEFQDASQARARLLGSLMRGAEKHLFAVGDDWQSINRFAGADLAVMTDFEAQFGKAVSLKLETTFRCPPSLCDLSSQFIRKNPRQLPKKVRSPKPDVPNTVRIISVESEYQIRSAVEVRVNEIAEEAAIAGKKVKVYLLGRYRKESEFLPRTYKAQWVDLEFITVHKSKGLEADHVILPKMSSETLGFPSRMEDDPVLQLAMPGGDSYEYAEERRLFYVALTRAKSTATLITLCRKESAFVHELVKEQQLEIRNVDGSTSSSEICPGTGCSGGFLVQRRSQYGLFYGCSTYPRCGFKRSIPGQRRGRPPI